MTEQCPECGGTSVEVVAGDLLCEARVCECSRPCPRCGGEGYQFWENDRGYTYASPCECKKAEARISIFNRARVPAHFIHATLENYIPSNPSQSNAVCHTHNVKWEFQPGDPGMLLYGPPGTGKTHLACAFIRFLTLERGIECRFLEFYLLVARIREALAQERSPNETISPLVDVPVLMVDELGKGRNTEFELALLDEMISSRYNAGKTTWFTSNYAIGAPPPRDKDKDKDKANAQPSYQSPPLARSTLQERIGERICSRLSEMCQIFCVEGEDHRTGRASAPKPPGYGILPEP